MDNPTNVPQSQGATCTLAQRSYENDGGKYSLPQRQTADRKCLAVEGEFYRKEWL
ncbi:MAG: hypothetical protein HYU71_10885 [Bacteroidetes bacterium]|nr:hypothetical protein [Bacteroidota bacterium]